MKYRFLRRYRYKQVNYKPGDEVELSEVEAQRINRDEPGTLELVPQKRQVEEPPADRMVKSAGSKRRIKREK